ncbi:transcriptional attenuator, LytR family [Lentzea albidocapillata subsp. violacea]|uniref:Transcriptional attenuator, LytR family n=1 Tax=Lentzea albidocapillata subsp. violacea TaxID=128104 RepID=A0A1G8XH93_9PSEU|nr:LCP family protein [Lentzea albidocapillata]SDJ89674.1 transcriptional attenuator, LytR family [Lentzea albidocapillata subsp. violacea]
MNELIRQAIAAEAEERVDSRTVMANLHKARKRKPLGLIVGVATLTAAAAAAAVIIPATIKKTEAAPMAAQTTPAQSVLLLGTDDHNRADAIVLARFGEDGSVDALSLSRELTYQSTRLSQLESPAKVVEAVEKLTGTRADHHAVIKMADFGKISQAVGGVEVCLKSAANDPYSGANFLAGKHTLTGDQALAFLRQRLNLPRGDLDRIARHQAFLAGIAAKLTKDNAVALAREVSRSVQVDAGWDVLEFAQRFQGPVKIRTKTFESTAANPSGQAPESGAPESNKGPLGCVD